MQIAKWLKCLMYLPQNWRPKRSNKQTPKKGQKSVVQHTNNKMLFVVQSGLDVYLELQIVAAPSAQQQQLPRYNCSFVLVLHLRLSAAH